MALPRSKDARLFYRCAFLRYDEARVLFKAGYSTGAIYLGGYGVECMLKALILTADTEWARRETLHTFKGGRAHDFEWLRAEYAARGGPKFPREVARHMVVINGWTTTLRYKPANAETATARRFLNAVNAVIRWADGRL